MSVQALVPIPDPLCIKVKVLYLISLRNFSNLCLIISQTTPQSSRPNVEALPWVKYTSHLNTQERYSQKHLLIITSNSYTTRYWQKT